MSLEIVKTIENETQLNAIYSIKWLQLLKFVLVPETAEEWLQRASQK